MLLKGTQTQTLVTLSIVLRVPSFFPGTECWSAIQQLPKRIGRQAFHDFSSRLRRKDKQRRKDAVQALSRFMQK
jgi:hypothetical protein